MALVALVALAFGAEMTRRRGEAYAEKAALHAKQSDIAESWRISRMITLLASSD